MNALRMHLRSNGHTFMQRQYETPLLDTMTAKTIPTVVLGVGTGSRLLITKKLFVWLVILLLQVCFIGSYWLMQNGINNDEATAAAMFTIGPDKLTHNNPNNLELVNNQVDFITSAQEKDLPYIKQTKILKRKQNIEYISKEPIGLNENKFKEDFAVRILNINHTDSELAMTMWNTNENEHLWCFIEGTANDTKYMITDNDQQQWDFEQCNCNPGWHGKDCGQPEVIWRALMTTRQQPLKLREPQHHIPHRLIAFIEGNFINLDMLELQLATLAKVVDYFMIFCKNHDSNLSEFRAFRKRIKDTLKTQIFVIYHCTQYNAVECEKHKAYQQMRRRLDFLQQSDLLLYLNDKIVVSTQALKFFKYYADEHVADVRFRLKHNVFGYFWQHPQKTHLSGILSSFIHEDMLHAAMETQPRSSVEADNTGMIVGDLNHFGGWYCEYCMQPNEQIAELKLMNASSSYQQNNVRFPNVTRHNNIDIDYIQKSIALGQHLDGKTKLLKVHSRDDKYYAPDYAQMQNWKFGSFLVNLYEVLDEESNEELYA